MNWGSVMKAFDSFDDCFKTKACGSCKYSRVGLGLCDTCSNKKYPLKKSENHHSDNYYTKEYDRVMKEAWEEEMTDWEYDWFGLVRRKKG